MSSRRALIVCAACLAALPIVAPALAQPALKHSDPTEEFFTYFYKDPRPARIVGFIGKYDAPPAERKWEAYPPVAGFFDPGFR